MAEYKVLRRGSAGPFVSMMELALSRAGYYTGALDGIFGTQAQRALRAYQSAFGLAPDGVAGPAAWASLESWLTGYFLRTVRPGDTLYGLARAYGATVRAVETANPDVDPLRLAVGSRVVIPRAFDVVSARIPFTPAYLDVCVRGLAVRYPFLGVSAAGRSVMGRPLHLLTLGAGGHQVFYNAAHHANEWITSPLLMTFLEKYAKSYVLGGTVFGQNARSLYEQTTLYMMPMVNPDGVALVTGETDSGPYFEGARAIAAAYPAIPFPEGWKANINGVDPNLQYPAGWSEAREIKFAQGYVSPAPRDYVGAAPLEIPESRAAYNLTRRQDFSLTISYHTQGRVIYWKYLDYLPPDSYEIAQKLAAVSGYRVELTPTASGYAGYKDWFIQDYDRPGYTVEAGIGTAPLPLSQFPEIYAENEGILTLGLTATL